jgi:hypothetical protein
MGLLFDGQDHQTRYEHAAVVSTWNQVMQPLLDMIANPATDLDALDQALRQLGSPVEGERFWVDIIRSDAFTAPHRARAIRALFERYVRSPTTLGELSRTLHAVDWMRPDSVDVVTDVGGLVPVTFNPQDTVLVWRPLGHIPAQSGTALAVYFRVRGRVARDTFVAVLTRKSDDKDAADSQVLEVQVVAGQ